jgi:hypothetical protein
MSLVIKMVSNGWILEDHSDPEMVRVQVFEGGDREEDDVKTMQQLLYTINDLVGPTTSRYSEHRIYVRIEPGDKFEDLQESGD